MHQTNLRKVGGSVMLAIPPVLLDILSLEPGVKVGISVRNGQLVVEPQRRPIYTLDELLAQCDSRARRGKQEREWLEGKPVGREIL